MLKRILATGALALFTLTSTAFAASAADVTVAGVPAAQAAVVAADISQAEADGLRYMREEEYLAHDVYVAMYEKWGLTVFKSIPVSEQRHTDAVAWLMESLGIADPAADHVAGVFADAKLQGLYDQLVAQGSKSIGDALKVGLAIEEIDILDLQARLAETDNAAIERVYNNLLAGSENHLRAFASNYEANTGESAVPQYMSAADFDQILAGTNGQGRGGSRGQARGSGRSGAGVQAGGRGNGSR